MRAGIKDLKNEIISYYNKEYGFAPAKKNVKILDVNKEKCVFECNGKIFGFDFNVSINMSNIYKIPPKQEDSL